MSASPPTLSGRLLRHVMLPLAGTWLAGTLVTLVVSHFFTQAAFDRSLLVDAQLMASSVRQEQGELRLVMTPREVSSALFDQVEAQYFAVTLPDGTLVAGQKGLTMPTGEGAVHFGNIEHDGQTLRAVALHHEAVPVFDVIIAETRHSRGVLLERMALFSLVPEVLLLLALTAWLRRAIKDDLRPLGQLQVAVGHRDANDLTPVPMEASNQDVARLAAAINSLLERLSRSIRAQREFAGNVAHELRTPLAGIRALAEYGLAQKDPQMWREQLAQISSSQARASRLVDKLLDLAWAQEAEAGLQLQPVLLDELVRTLLLRFLPRADAAGADLGARGIDAPVEIRADATLLEGIITNLLDNALRHGAAGGAEPFAITVSVHRYADEVILTVQDNGPGVPGEMQAQLMRRGTQGEAAQLMGEGAGLGLALVAQYAKLMNARVMLGSGPSGRGWQCSIAFPATGAHPAA